MGDTMWRHGIGVRPPVPPPAQRTAAVIPGSTGARSGVDSNWMALDARVADLPPTPPVAAAWMSCTTDGSLHAPPAPPPAPADVEAPAAASPPCEAIDAFADRGRPAGASTSAGYHAHLSSMDALDRSDDQLAQRGSDGRGSVVRSAGCAASPEHQEWL
eukprot:NODE_5650_length_565_cov_151.652941.p2 GENE.NODE_5650_length_565_cov_151.652941~~NODE_5650_length_565_cov_151.652941.p2  ORF type:complete len:159 (+),score=35.90 NODE_5650_length_565_cov_151.652941:3-479(+)